MTQLEQGFRNLGMLPYIFLLFASPSILGAIEAAAGVVTQIGLDQLQCRINVTGHIIMTEDISTGSESLDYIQTFFFLNLSKI